MRMRWKLVGLAGLAGVAATGVVVARQRRAQRDYQPDELRDRLHRRLDDVSRDDREPAASSDQTASPGTGDGHA
jgi:hypothetical protein